MIERWKPVVGRPGYEVSDQGGVRSVDRIVLTTNGQRRRYRGVTFTCTVGKRGYPVVKLQARTLYVHTLVLEAFVGPAPSGFEALHGNDVRSDNRLANLRWGTRLENVTEMNAHGRNAHSNTERCPRGHLLAEPNLVPCQLRRGRREYWSCQLARGQVRHALLRDGVVLDFVTTAHWRYAQIMRGAACA